jgi:fructoselysine transporter
VMQTSILGVVPWREAQNSQYIVSTFVERIYGTRAAAFATIMILWIAFASLFTTLLSYSRVPFAAAEDGNFFPVFARVHPTKHFPHISLLFLGAVALAFSVLFRLSDVIDAILAMRVIVQFIGQGVGVMLLRRRWPPGRLPFKMWFYPLPAVLSIISWIWIFVSTGLKFAVGGLIVIALGIVTYMIQARYRRLWPFVPTPSAAAGGQS